MQCQLMESLFQAIKMIHQEQGTPRDYGAGGLLYHAEVNLLEAVSRHPEQGAAALASALGISKGALTQTARKLMEKGLVTQHHPPKNRRTKFHRLTEAGEVALRGHAQFHAEANARVRAYLCGRSSAEKRVLSDFFQTLAQCGQVCLFECRAAGCQREADTVK